MTEARKVVSGNRSGERGDGGRDGSSRRPKLSLASSICVNLCNLWTIYPVFLSTDYTD
jgi:hypothetical protein